MKKSVAALILFSMALISSCNTGQPVGGYLPLEVDQVEMLQLESFPVQHVLHVEGWLPDPCSSPDWEVTETEREVHVNLFAVSGGSTACIQVLAPFSVNIPLGSLIANTQVLLNGDPIGPE